MENVEQSSQHDLSPIIPQLPPTLIEEISFFIQRMPAWQFVLFSLLSVFVFYQFVGGGLLFLLFGLNLTEQDVLAFRWATMLGQVFFLLAPTIVFAKLRFPDVKNIFRFGKINLKELLLVVVAVVALQQLSQGYLMVQDSLPIHLPPIVQKLVDQIKEMMEEMTRQLTTTYSIPEFLFVVLVIAVTPAVCEELLFRGLIQRTLEAHQHSITPTHESNERRGITAAVVTGITFALYHLNPFTLIPLIALGVYFGYVVYRTQNILTSMVAHFVNNFLACLAVYLHLDDDFLAVAPAGPATPTLLAANFALSAVVFVVATYYLVRITNRTDVQPVEQTPD